MAGELVAGDMCPWDGVTLLQESYSEWGGTEE